jgi:uncharacterized membrane protein
MTPPLSPFWRKTIYAISFELIGILVASLSLMAMSEASTSQSLILSTICATVALIWSYGFNSLFEAWEANRPTRGRPLPRRIAHAVLFEGGLVVILVPVMAWWLNVTLFQALFFEAGLIVVFIIYTFAFTWAFDRIFGLPQSAL